MILNVRKLHNSVLRRLTASGTDGSVDATGETHVLIKSNEPNSTDDVAHVHCTSKEWPAETTKMRDVECKVQDQYPTNFTTNLSTFVIDQSARV